jgi:hypothetical protein
MAQEKLNINTAEKEVGKYNLLNESQITDFHHNGNKHYLKSYGILKLNWPCKKIKQNKEICKEKKYVADIQVMEERNG